MKCTAVYKAEKLSNVLQISIKIITVGFFCEMVCQTVLVSSVPDSCIKFIMSLFCILILLLSTLDECLNKWIGSPQ